MLWVWISIRARCTLCDKVCMWLATGRWFSPGSPASSTNKTDHNDITEILLKVALNTIKRNTIIKNYDSWIILQNHAPSVVATPAKECVQSANGMEYFGSVRQTKNGVPCQKWGDQVPHSHSYGYISEQDDYCRNPYGYSSFPWCYTVDPDIRWDYCDIPRCWNSLLGK